MRLGTPHYNRAKTIGYLLRCDGSFASWRPDFQSVYDNYDDTWRHEDQAPHPSAHISVIHDEPAHRYRCLHCHAHWADTLTGMLVDAYNPKVMAEFMSRPSPFMAWVRGSQSMEAR